jgi:phospholipid transport system substrate-binding protein
MLVKKILVGLGLVIAAAGAATAVSAADREPKAVAARPPAAAPTTVIETFHAALIDVMRQGPALGGEARFRKLAPVVDRTFDLPLMTQVAVGPRWSSLSGDQQARLIAAFRRFTIANYVRHFDSYDGERFEVEPTAQATNAGQMVMSRLVPRDHKPVALDYVMRETPTGWRVVDVYAEGKISELARRRSEFSALLTSGGVDGLADRLVERAQTLIDQPA